MRSLQWILTGIALLFSPLYVYPQAQGGGGDARGSGTISITATTSGPFLKGTTGVPFSADVIEENDQTLADGNHIHREMHGRIFRDAEGRTRQENEFPVTMNGETRVRVIIMDPVQQVFVSLDLQNKVAKVQHVGQQPASSTVGANKPAAPSNQSNLPKVSPKQQEHLGTEDLGTMEIEGFVVTGKRVTHTIDAGEIGNDKPLVSVYETWFSPDLKEALLTKSENPQSGQNIRKLVNIHLGEPDPLLFQPPPDYTVKDISH
jgi:hypothetical protein